MVSFVPHIVPSFLKFTQMWKLEFCWITIRIQPGTFQSGLINLFSPQLSSCLIERTKIIHAQVLSSA